LRAAVEAAAAAAAAVVVAAVLAATAMAVRVHAGARGRSCEHERVRVFACACVRACVDLFQHRIVLRFSGGTKRTEAVDDSSDEDNLTFLRDNEPTRLREIQWAFTSCIVSLFKNIRSVRACVRACARARVRSFVRACLRAYERAIVRWRSGPSALPPRCRSLPLLPSFLSVRATR
jgi:hypothetical protein